MDKRNAKAWLYLLPAIAFLGVFMVYPLVDVFVYSFEEGYNSASQTFSGVGLFNYRYVLRDPYFLQALKNTFILVIITVPVSTGLALLISLGLSSIEKLRGLFQTVYFLPYVTNTLAVGLVFMILFKKTAYTDGLVNVMLHWFGSPGVDFIDGPYWAKMFVLCFYTVWVVLPFKILILTSALASVKQDYYNAARIDGTSRRRIFTRITLPLISPMIFYLVVTGFIGAFKAYSDAVALFGVEAEAAAIGRRFFQRISLFYVFFGLACSMRGTIEGTGRVVYSSAVSIAALLLRIALSYLLAGAFLNMAIAYAEGLHWIFMVLCFLPFFLRKDRWI